jgi:hypothetical protein
VAGKLQDQVIDRTVRLVHFRAGSLSADPLGGPTSIEDPHLAADPWFESVDRWFEQLGWPAVAGAVLLIASIFLPDGWPTITAMIVGIILFLPWFFYVYVLTIWHWKERYRGYHNRLWGALLLVETSGWFKIIYWFRHIVPDWQERGRYARSDRK